MKSVELKATSRGEVRSKSALKALRKEGRVPAVIYGSQDNINFHVDEITFSKLIHTTEVYFIDLVMEDKTVKAVIKDVQFHPVTDKVIHIDFMEVVDNKLVSMDIPVVFNGKSIGVMNGGKRREKLRKILCKALPKDMPEVISVEISQLKIGMDIKVKDIKIDGVEFLNAPNAVVIAVKTSRVAVAEDEEEETEGEEGATEEAAAE
jgi:large subunit ribosomal protein L25